MRGKQSSHTSIPMNKRIDNHKTQSKLNQNSTYLVKKTSKKKKIANSQMSPPPIEKANSSCNGSTLLYDSFELQAVTRQLNKAMAIGSTTAFSPTYLSYIKSPFYRQRLNRLHKENSKIPKIELQPANFETEDRRNKGKPTAGVVQKLWKTFKQRLQRYKKAN